MKRSEINKNLIEAKKFLKTKNFILPPFSKWSTDELKEITSDYEEIIENALGWDVTDFGSDDFDNTGLLLFTLRNGNINSSKYKKTYAEKILIVKEEQVTPFHYHLSKMEDIINRGGGNLIVQLYNSDENGKLDETSQVVVNTDGKRNILKAGTKIVLKPGESVTLQPKLYHSFWGEKGKGTILVGEVSQTNDDRNDNYFINKLPRFSKIIEDEKPVHLLVSDYADHVKIGG